MMRSRSMPGSAGWGMRPVRREGRTTRPAARARATEPPTCQLNGLGARSDTTRFGTKTILRGGTIDRFGTKTDIDRGLASDLGHVLRRLHETWLVDEVPLFLVPHGGF